jgi:hypothetical protein
MFQVGTCWVEFDETLFGYTGNEYGKKVGCFEIHTCNIRVVFKSMPVTLKLIIFPSFDLKTKQLLYSHLCAIITAS